jgi:hypothetical protein
MSDSPVVSSSPRRGVSRNVVNFVIDSFTLLAMLAMVATGLLMRFVLPPGSRGGRGLGLWGLTRHDWGDVHFWLSVALGGLLVIHLLLHWTWVCTVVNTWLHPDRARRPAVSAARRCVLGVGFILVLAAVLVGFLGIASASVARNHMGEEPQQRGWQGGRSSTAVIEEKATPTRLLNGCQVLPAYPTSA